VEDNKFNQSINSRILKDNGCEVDIADDGLHAIDYCKKDPNYDLVLMDFQMPNMNGIDATKELIDIKVKAPIVGLTANADELARSEALRSGMKRLLMKPIRSSDLLEIVDKAAEKLL
jgi:CheY-like chemotaxis protein